MMCQNEARKRNAKNTEEISIDHKLISREVVEQKESPLETHYDVAPDLECGCWFGKRKDKKK